LVKRGQEFMRVRRSLLRTLSGVPWASRVKAVDPEGFYLGKIGLCLIFILISFESAPVTLRQPLGAEQAVERKEKRPATR
jgi:hypothetical protein